MKNGLREEFGCRLVSFVRDGSMAECQLLLRLDRAGASAKRLKAAAAAAGGQIPSDTMVTECADAAIAYVLSGMDEDFLHLSFLLNEGESVYLPEDGQSELCGWYMGTPGWRSWYSSERIPDKYDLRHIATKDGGRDDSDDPAPNLDDLEMPRRAIEELGILLVRHVRDVAIQSCDLQLLPHSETPMAKRWRKAAIPHGGKVPPEVLIPDCVDETIYTFLRAIDKGLLPLSFTAENGETVDLTKAGNLAERYIEKGGWRDQFSKERIGKD